MTRTVCVVPGRAVSSVSTLTLKASREIRESAKTPDGSVHDLEAAAAEEEAPAGDANEGTTLEELLRLSGRRVRRTPERPTDKLS